MRRKLLFVSIPMLLLVAGSFWLTHNAAQLLANAITTLGSEALGVPVRAASADLEPSKGKGRLNQLQIGQPPGFGKGHALEAAIIGLQIDTATLTAPVIHLHEILVDAPRIVYVKRGEENNFEVIAAMARERAGESRGDGKRLIIDRLVIRGGQVTARDLAIPAAPLSLQLPDLVLSDIGKKQGGATPGEVGRIVSQALTQRLQAQAASALARAAANATVGGFESAAGLTGQTGKALKGLLGR